MMGTKKGTWGELSISIQIRRGVSNLGSLSASLTRPSALGISIVFSIQSPRLRLLERFDHLRITALSSGHVPPLAKHPNHIQFREDLEEGVTEIKCKPWIENP